MSTPPHADRLRGLFRERFGRRCAVVARAPGRVNLIGEHTDYNEGFVLPMALEHSVWVATAARDDGQVRTVTLDLDEEQSWPLAGWTADSYPHWTSYVAGVGALLGERGVALGGCDLLIRSDVPPGGGLSSSAALEVATARALVTLCGKSIELRELADLCRTAEHTFAGVLCGIMDQYVSTFAQVGCAFLLDCRTRAWEHIPLALGEHIVLVVDSGVRHQLAAGQYAERQQQCRSAVEFFRAADSDVRALRDVSPDAVQACAGRMDAGVAARARHVTSENQRTLAAVDALRRGDVEEFGRLMAASHDSLRDDYEVSCPEIERLVETIQRVPGVLGARMTGGGFGGCVVAVARRESSAQIESALHAKYDAAGYGPSRMIHSAPGGGASIEYS